jgi:hypothetical protein
LKKRLQGQEGKGGDISSCWMILKEARRYWKLKEEPQDCTLWKTHFARDYGPVARQTTTSTSTDIAL